MISINVRIGKIRPIALILWCITLLWMCFIFQMSAQNGEASGNTSGKVVERIAVTLVPGFSDMTEAEKEATVAKLSFPVRKLAHFTEYAVLGALLTVSLAFSSEKTSLTRKKFAAAVIIGWLYAASDELHQKFVSGRAGMFTDVLIDGSGALAGCAAAALIVTLVLRRLSRNKDSKDCDR